MGYEPIVEEQRFVLSHVVGIESLAEHPDFVAAEPVVVDAILSGAADFASGYWAPLNRVGDISPPRWIGGEVTMPPGFREAYRAFIDGEWSTLGAPVRFGGQGLPASLAAAVAESFGTANLAFNLGPMLSLAAVDALVSHGSDELQQAYLTPLVTGAWMGTMNLTEPQAGSDVGALRSVEIGRAHV